MRRTQERLRSLNDQIPTLSAEQGRLQDLHLVIGQVETFAKMLDGSLEEADWLTKRQVIRTLVKHIEICSEEVKVVYRIDSLPFAQAPKGGVLQHCLRRDQPVTSEPVLALCVRCVGETCAAWDSILSLCR